MQGFRLPGGQGPKRPPLFTWGWTQMPWDSGIGPLDQIGIIVSISTYHAVFELQINSKEFFSVQVCRMPYLNFR